VALEVNHTARKFDRQKWCHSRRATEQIKQPKDFLANKHLCLLDKLRKGISFSGGLAERWIAECVYMVLEELPAKTFPLGPRTLLGDGISNRKNVPWCKKA
jgi:hypothetical protein